MFWKVLFYAIQLLVFVGLLYPSNIDVQCSIPWIHCHIQVSQFLNHCHSEDNWACLPGPLYNSSQKGAVCSIQATRWVSCSRSLNLAPNSNASENPPSRSTIQFLLRPRKITGSREVAKGLMAFLDKWFFAVLAYVDLWVWLEARKVIARLLSPHCVHQQGSTRLSNSFNKPLVLLIRNT